MKQPKEFTVDNQIYVVQPFPTTDGMRLLIDLVALVGPTAIEVMFKVKHDPQAYLDDDSKGIEVARVMNDLIKNLKADQIDSMFKRILRHTLIGHTSTTAESLYDTHFSERYVHLFLTVYKSLEAQFGDFLSVLKGFVGSTTLRG